MATTIDLAAATDEWKVVYRVLHAHLTSHLELMDCEVFADLQRALQTRARAEGVDVTDHAAWDAWLGHEDPATCDERLTGRRVLD
jgi:hypothetical protein